MGLKYQSSNIHVQYLYTDLLSLFFVKYSLELGSYVCLYYYYDYYYSSFFLFACKKLIYIAYSVL